MAGINDGQRVNSANSNAAWISKNASDSTIGVLTINNSTQSTDKDTGALIVEGGIGVEKNLNVGGDVAITGNLTVNGTQTTLNTTTIELEDNNILLNKGGNNASAESGGVDIVRTSDNGAFRFDSALTSKWKLGLVSAMSEVIVSALAQTITGIKTFAANIISNADIVFDKVTAANINTKDDSATQDLNISSGAASSGDSGVLAFYSGDAASGYTGDVSLYSGTSSGFNKSSGNASLGSGDSTDTGGSSGAGNLYSGYGVYSSGAVFVQSGGSIGSTGELQINSGASSASQSGDISISSGNASTLSGNINLRTGTGATQGQLSVSASQLNMNSKKIINVLDPTSNQHAATKKYVDDSIPTGASLVTAASGQLAATTLNAALAELELEKQPRTYSTTATVAGTTTLTVASNFKQYFTGSTTQTVVLPVASTMTLGFGYFIVNLSSGSLTVNSSGSNLVTTVLAGTSVFIDCILTSGTSAASWNVLSLGGIANDSVTGAQIRLNNDQYLRSRDAANSADINMFKVNTSDTITFAQNLLPSTSNARNLGSSSFRMSAVHSQTFISQFGMSVPAGAEFSFGTSPSGLGDYSAAVYGANAGLLGIMSDTSATASSSPVAMETGKTNSGSSATGSAYLRTGNQLGTGVSGNIELKTGTSTTTRGNITLDANAINITPRSGDPSSLSNGDLWFDGTNLKIRVGGVTKTVTIL